MTTQLSPADAADKHITLIALTTFLFSLLYLSSAGQFLVSESVASTMEIGEKVLALAAIAVVLPILLWKFRNLSATEKQAYKNPEGFVTEVFKKACTVSWAWTFVFLVALKMISRRAFADFPPEFYIQLILGVMLGIFSLAFFLKSRVLGDDGSSDDYGDDDHGVFGDA